MEDTPTWLFALIFFAFVLLPGGMFYLAARMLYRAYIFKKGAVLVTGKVVDLKKIESRTEHGHTINYQPTFEYAGPNGELLRGETATMSQNLHILPGSERSILVNFDVPGTVHMPDNGIYLTGVVMLAISGIIACFGIFALWPID